MSHIIVASTNPVKINAAVGAFKKMFPDQKFTSEGVSVDSGVPDQPMSDKETFRGAKNRAENARQAKPKADFWVGQEAGVDYIKYEGMKEPQMFTWAWMYILDKDGHVGNSRTNGFRLPPEIVEMINQGMELAEADDKFFSRINSKQTTGTIGILTGDAVDRTKLYELAMINALVPFKNPNLYFNQK